MRRGYFQFYLLLIHPCLNDPRVQYQKEAVEEGIYGIVSVPFTIKRRVIGVLRLYTKKTRIFSKIRNQFYRSIGRNRGDCHRKCKDV